MPDTGLGSLSQAVLFPVVASAGRWAAHPIGVAGVDYSTRPLKANCEFKLRSDHQGIPFKHREASQLKLLERGLPTLGLEG